MTTFGTVVDWESMQVLVPDPWRVGHTLPADPGVSLMVRDSDTAAWLGFVATGEQGSWRVRFPDHVKRIDVSGDGGGNWVIGIEGIPDETV